MRVMTKRMEKVPFSGIRRVFEEAERLERAGIRVINLCIGRPDFDTPAHIKEAAKKALDEGFVHYTSNFGLEELRQALADKLRKENGLPWDKSHVIVTLGANEAVFLALTALLDTGDEVLIPDPAWPHYFYCAPIAGAVPVSVPLWEERRFVLDPADVEKAITPATRMLLINSPHNPTGAVYDERTMGELAEVAKRHDLIVVADEVYEKLVYDDARHISIGALPGMAERTLTIGAFSKAYSMTGWRVGFVAGSLEMIEPMVKVHQYTCTCACSFAQKGAVAALRGPQDMVEEMRREFDRRRRLVVDRLAEVPELCAAAPKGAFYAFLNIRKLGMTSEEAAEFFLREGRVALVPGNAFGVFGEGYLRLAYSASYADVAEAMNRIVELARTKITPRKSG